MGNPIDERIVQMVFNNKQFESGAQTTINTLGKLESALKLKGATDGLNSIENASHSFSLDGIASSIETINSKFSIMGAVAFSTLNSIVSKATDAGLKMIKSLSTDQIAAGWQKFGEKTGSVATLVSQGYSLDEVNEQMDRLNWFTDETSYNYVDMANNIGKFTASGQGLEDSVTAMMGIANWAALSGQNATKASSAMYQLSQAMGKGALRYDDWKSIQNASMDTKEFREQALGAAVELGKIKKNLDGTYKVGKKTYTMNEMFSSDALTRTEWLSSDVMMKTFKQYSAAVDQLYDHVQENGGTASEAMEELGDSVDGFGLKAFKAAQEARSWADVIDSVKDAVSTGWMSTFESIFGNYDQATKLWTSLANNLYEVFMFGAEGRNELFAGWNELGGHASMLNSLENIFEVLLNVMEEAKKVFTGLIPSITSERLYDITLKIEEFTEKLKNNDKFMFYVNQVFTFLGHAINLARKGLIAFGKVTLGVIKKISALLSPLTSKIAPLIRTMANIIIEFDLGIRNFDKFSNALEKVKEKLSPLGDIFRNIKETIKNFFSIFSGKKEFIPANWLNSSSLFGNILDKLKAKFKDANIIGTILDKISEKFEKFKNFLSQFKPMLERVADGIKNTFSKISEAFYKGDEKIVTNFVDTGFLGLITLAIKKFLDIFRSFKGIGAGINNLFYGLGTGIKETFSALKSSLEETQKVLKAKALMDIAKAIAILAGSLLILSLINTDRLGSALVAMGVLMAELGAFVTIFDKLNGKSKFRNINTVSTTMIKMSAAVLILAIAMKSLSSLSMKEIGRGLIAITGLLAVTTAAALLLSRFSKKVAKGAKGMIKFSIAIAILAAVMKSLSTLSWEEIGKGLVAILGLMGIMTGVVLLLSNYAKRFTKSSIGMILFAAAIAILAKVMKSLMDLSWEEIAKGLAALGGIAGIMAGFVILAGLAKHILSTSIAFLIISAAMAILAGVMKKFAAMKWEEIGKAFTMFGGMLAIFSVLAIVISKTGSTVALFALAASLIVLGIAFDILYKSFAKAGSMDWGEIGKGFVVFAGALVLLGVAALVLGSAIPAMLGVAGAIALLGLGLQLIATSFVTFKLAEVLRQFKRGVEGLSAKLRAGMFVTIFKNILEVLKAIVQFIPVFIASFVVGIINGITIIANSGAKLVPAIIKIVSMILDALATLIPKIVWFGLKIILALLQGLDENIGQITAVAGSVIAHFLIGLSQALPMIIVGAIVLMYNFIVGMANGIRLFQDLIFDAVKNLVSAIIEFVLTAIQEAVELIPVVGEKWANGLEGAKEKVRETLAPEDIKPISMDAANALVEGFSANSGEVENAAAEAAESGKSGFESILELFTGSGGEATSSFATGMLEQLGISLDAGVSVGEDTSDEMGNVDYTPAGLSADQGFAKGLRDNAWIVNNAATSVGSGALKSFKASIQSKSPSKAFEKEGYNSDQGYANGLIKFSGIVEDASAGVGKKSIMTLSESISKIDDYIAENMDSSPVIRPVLDMSDIASGVSAMDGMMDRSYSLSHSGLTLAHQNEVLFSRSKDDVNIQKSDEGVIQAVSKLGNNIDELGKSMQGLGFYIDGKKVGRIVTPSVNRALYTDSIRKGRNN